MQPVPILCPFSPLPHSTSLVTSSRIALFIMPIPKFSERSSQHGIYHSILPIIKNDKKSLALISPDEDLTTYASSIWGKGNVTTRFKYRDGKTRDEAIVNLFGETLGPTDGTSVGALGGTVLQPGQVFFLLVFSFTRSNQ